MNHEGIGIAVYQTSGIIAYLLKRITFHGNRRARRHALRGGIINGCNVFFHNKTISEEYKESNCFLNYFFLNKKTQSQ